MIDWHAPGNLTHAHARTHINTLSESASNCGSVGGCHWYGSSHGNIQVTHHLVMQLPWQPAVRCMSMGAEWKGRARRGCLLVWASKLNAAETESREGPEVQGCPLKPSGLQTLLMPLATPVLLPQIDRIWRNLAARMGTARTLYPTLRHWLTLTQV